MFIKIRLVIKKFRWNRQKERAYFTKSIFKGKILWQRSFVSTTTAEVEYLDKYSVGRWVQNSTTRVNGNSRPCCSMYRHVTMKKA